MTDDQSKQLEHDIESDHTPQDHAPEELHGVISALGSGPLDEDSELDAQELDEGDESFVDADELFSVLAKLQAMLEDQGKEIRGLRREMRELRESQGAGQMPAQSGFRPQGERPREERPRDDRPERSFSRDRDERGPREGGYQGNRESGQGGYRGNRDGGNGAREGGFRPREDRPQGERGGYQGNREGGSFRPREDRGGAQGAGQGAGGYRGNREGGQGGYQGNRESGGFRPREDRPQGERGGQSGEFRPRARTDRGWSGGNRRD
ncbi:hypothetical protein [Deinococcus sp.]|uniref:hypothetical protein n=1 Tax=Deinococcus sp. TaxID=47478 RepID=UPI003CC5B1D8